MKKIKIITNKLYQEDSPNDIPMPKDINQKLLNMTTQGYFMYKTKLYKQIIGVIMSS